MMNFKPIMAMAVSASLVWTLAPNQTLHALEDEQVSVKLMNYLGNKTSITLGFQGKYVLKGKEDVVLSSTYTLKKVGNGFQLTGGGQTMNLSAPFTITPVVYGKENVVKVSGRAYMGDVKFTIESGYIRPINTLPLEHYLKGVVPKEMPASWKEEALKAQAVAARTYVEKKGNTVITDTQTHQVYGGFDWTDSTTRAVEATEGEVLTFKGTFVETLYTSSNGGKIESNRGAWGTTLVPYLQAKNDPFDPQNAFTYKASPQQAINLVSGTNGVKVKSVENIRIKSKTEGGYADIIEFTVNGNTKKLDVKATTVRSRLGGLNMRSTYLTSIQKSGTSFVFNGKGFGHGVGMSQYGAKAMAEKGYTYKEILGFYYSGTTLEKDEKEEPIQTPIPEIKPIVPTTPSEKPKEEVVPPTETSKDETTNQDKEVVEDVIKEEKPNEEVATPEAPKEDKHVTYIVKKGDSLYGISRKYDISVEQLKTWNTLTSNTIYVGQKLTLKKPTQNETIQTTTYIVKKGDTLYRIARQFDVSIDQLKTWNNLKSNTIYIQQKLSIKK